MSASSPIPAAYDIRVSPRARHINLRVTPEAGLVITLPRRCSRAALEEVLMKKRDWIERSLAWAAGERARLEAVPPVVIPAHVDLRALGEYWTVELNPTASRTARVTETGFSSLRLSGRAYDTAAATGALKRWLIRHARLRLVERMSFLAGAHGFQTASTTIRNQKSCWASCTPAGKINLNVKLMFLPPRLSDYVLLHELCHTVHLDHSRRFWMLVAAVDPRYRERRRELAKAWEFIPAWVGP